MAEFGKGKLRSTIASIHCTKVADIPTEPHFAIIKFGTYYSSDEAGNVDTTEYHAYFDEDTWKKEISKLAIGNKNFSAMRVNPASYTVKVDVAIA